LVRDEKARYLRAELHWDNAERTYMMREMNWKAMAMIVLAGLLISSAAQAAVIDNGTFADISIAGDSSAFTLLGGEETGAPVTLDPITIDVTGTGAVGTPWTVSVVGGLVTFVEGTNELVYSVVADPAPMLTQFVAGPYFQVGGVELELAYESGDLPSITENSELKMQISYQGMVVVDGEADPKMAMSASYSVAETGSSIVIVPTPSALAFGAIGLVGMVIRRRRN